MNAQPTSDPLVRQLQEQIRHGTPDCQALALALQRFKDYEEVLADHRRLVRELDWLLNGTGAAQQASLCDIVGQVQAEGIRSAGWVS